jgi:hypothetical protein
MINKIKIGCSIAVLLLSSFSANAETPQDGSFKIDGSAQVWSTEKSNWITPEQFWQNFTANNGGLTWQKSREYPPYDQVKEHDTFMVELDSGICLMEFFHSRWRRANDVQRWDDKFNSHSACENVFE